MIKKYLEDYTIYEGENLVTTLKRIDNNKKRFLIVINKKEQVTGVLTDGDVRRGLIAGLNLDAKVDEIKKADFDFLLDTAQLSDCIELFKGKSIDFIPILDKDKHLINVVTKMQLHAFLLQDIKADILYNFFSIDETLVDSEIYQRPWGFYKSTVINDFFQAKVITILPNKRLSLQAHKRREEFWIIVHGQGIVRIGDSEIEAKCGSCHFIPKGCVHRLTNTDDTENLIVSEVQLGDYFGEDDIVRYEDDFGRV